MEEGKYMQAGGRADCNPSWVKHSQKYEMWEGNPSNSLQFCSPSASTLLSAFSVDYFRSKSSKWGSWWTVWFWKLSSPSCSKTFNNFCLVLFSNLAYCNILYICCIFSAEIFLVVENYKIHSKSRLITRRFSSAWKLDSREEFSLVVHPLLKLGRKNLGGKLNPTEQHKRRKRTHIW